MIGSELARTNVAAACVFVDLSMAAYIAPERNPDIVARRTIASSLVYTRTNGAFPCLSWPDLARASARVNHSTFISRYRKILWIMGRPEWHALEQEWADQWATKKFRASTVNVPLVVRMILAGPGCLTSPTYSARAAAASSMALADSPSTDKQGSPTSSSSTPIPA